MKKTTSFSLLLAQVHRDVRPLQTTLETILTMAGLTRPDGRSMP
jgi:hypothetical protein